MRTTIRLDDELLVSAKQFAARTGRTLTALIEDSLREVLTRTHAVSAESAVRLTTFRGDGTLPGVDLDDGAFDGRDVVGQEKER